MESHAGEAALNPRPGLVRPGSGALIGFVLSRDLQMELVQEAVQRRREEHIRRMKSRRGGIGIIMISGSGIGARNPAIERH